MRSTWPARYRRSLPHRGQQRRSVGATGTTETVPRRRSPGTPVGPEAPAELSNPDAEIWKSADLARRWLESHRLIRRLRPLGPLAAMSAAERVEHARGLWGARHA